MEIIEIILRSAEGAFLQVSVFVGAVLLIFGYINFKQEGRFIESIEKSKKFQPIIGAFLGLTPGCGGAIFVMPLFLKGSVTFGTIIATLIATMGDAAFVIIAVDPMSYLWVSVLSFVIAIITGYLVDFFGIGQNLYLKLQKDIEKKNIKAKAKEYQHDQGMKHMGHKEGDIVDIMLHHNGHEHTESSFAHKFTHVFAYKLYWVVIAIGLVLGIMLLFQVDVNTELGVTHLGTFLGVFGTGFSILYMIVTKKFLVDDSHDEEEHKAFSLKETLIHNAEETAFVTTWVFLAYTIYDLSVYLIGGESVVLSFMTATGILSVIVGALIGLIPGCGPQIIFVTLFTKGAIPFAALLANAISQDGDALFPLLAIDKRTSLWATVITTIPALLFGLAYYLIFEMS